jgi:simple sugar transport system ATP-binding protein
LILDEPTAVLAPQETAELFTQLRLLKDASYSIIIITHKLKEIKQLCDRVTILRAGCDRGTFRVGEVSEREISRLMVGGEAGPSRKKTSSKPGTPILQVFGLTVMRENRSRAVDEVSFSVREGEIVCLAGVEGNGQQETVSCVTGLERSYSGKIHLLGQDLSRLSIKQIRRTGLAHVPEDRLRTGSNLSASILDNLISNSYDEGGRWGLLNYRRLKEAARELVRRYRIRMRDLMQPFRSLSGGNMQKVIIAREFTQQAAVVVADQPTRGVDVGAIAFIHQELLKLRAARKAILLVSADINEVLDLADRILVFHGGRIVAQVSDVPRLSEEQLGRYMLGIDVMPDLVCL